ncbi:uncharacterized protein LOC105166449 [Sesamum indicum]|uniref:Uncharacterized protein LOC105166449 n=1 Tax=Sesamum indicum TaxID=4182 RepID=A0A6I9TIX8_SESIN|nr:uncharacterized protein LOC105166449 [Sesamum indicum]
MPRPGPRPYECVRRAWHSERHQPMRGLIIQQIFRLVHDNHPSATKKNKEWQEKLPIVVLRAEEIMYSKANSEAEYSNSETLWDRVNEAVDTIIRKDERTESGELLPPCVEAALNLGCVPVRASRSQRHNNPRTYLRPTHQECGDMPPKVLNEKANDRNSVLMPLHISKSSMLKMPQNVDTARSVWECNKHITLNTTQRIASSCDRHPSIGNRNSIEFDHDTSLNRGSVYPLYYGTSFKPEVPQLGFQEPQKSDSIIVGVPIFSSVAETTEVGCLQNLFPYGDDINVAKETYEAASKDYKGKGSEMGFDLSLRLGLFSDSNSSREKESGCGADRVGHRVVPVEGRLKEKEFSFFPVESAYEHSWLNKSRWNSEGENQNTEVASRKRKLPTSADIETDQFFWSQDSTSNHLAGQMRRPGL